jgi:hypothetical protein
MKDSQPVSVSGIGNTAPWNRGKKRTLADTVLITSWMVGYKIILGTFRFANLVESLRSDRPLDSSTARVARTMKDLPSG